MGCKKDKPKQKPKPGKYQCTNCGAVSKKESGVCKPKKIKKDS